MPQVSKLPPITLTPGQWQQCLDVGAAMQYDQDSRYVLQPEQGVTVWRAVNVQPQG